MQLLCIAPPPTTTTHLGQEFKTQPAELKSRAWTPDPLNVTGPAMENRFLSGFSHPGACCLLPMRCNMENNWILSQMIRQINLNVPSEIIPEISLYSPSETDLKQLTHLSTVLTWCLLHQLSCCVECFVSVSWGSVFALERFTASPKHANWALSFFRWWTILTQSEVVGSQTCTCLRSLTINKDDGGILSPCFLSLLYIRSDRDEEILEIMNIVSSLSLT